jgi:DNA-binding beta-propeller fold protein YncE
MEADGRVGLRRLGTALACWAAIAVFMLGGVSAEAQTAHAGGTISIGSGFSAPAGVAMDRNGNVFVADDNENVVKEIVAVDGVVSSSSTVNTISSGFDAPCSVAVDGSGNVFVADQDNNVVKEIVAVGVNFFRTSTLPAVASATR